MQYSKLSNRVSGAGSSVWDDHYKAVARKEAGEDVIVMSIGDPDFDTPKVIVDAAIASLSSGDTHYTEVAGRPRLRRAVANNIGKLAGSSFSADNVVITAGTQNALYAAAALLLDPGDEVLVLEPMFTTYFATIESTGAKLIPIPCPASDHYQPKLDVLIDSITAKTKALFFASPANPTGAIISRENLAKIAEICIENDLWVVSDEIYCDFIFEGEHTSISSIPGMIDRTIIVGSLSKSYAMTGWRVGWAIGPKHFVKVFSDLNLAITYGLPGFIQEAAALALEEQIPEIHDMKLMFKKRRDTAIEVLQDSPMLNLAAPVAGMFLMIDIRASGLSGLDFSKKLYAEYGVSVLDGAEFGDSGKGFIRISFAASEQDVYEGCLRIKSLAESLTTRSTELHRSVYRRSDFPRSEQGHLEHSA